MCKCTPNIRTPFCGKPGCEWPEQRSSKERVSELISYWESCDPGDETFIREDILRDTIALLKSESVPSNQSDFDADLERLEQVEIMHKALRPELIKPDTFRGALENIHDDRGFLLAFIDKLWREYTTALSRLDARPADEPTSAQVSKERLAQALRNLRDVAHREVSPRYSAALDEAFTLADIALGEFDSEGEVSREADVGPGGGVRATHATGSAPSKPGAAEPPSAGVKCTHCNGNGYNEPIYDEQDGWIDETPCETCNGSGRITTVEQYLKTLPANWHEDSSLETWFPITAEELKRLKDERASQPPSALRAGDRVEWRGHLGTVTATGVVRVTLDSGHHHTLPVDQLSVTKNSVEPEPEGRGVRDNPPPHASSSSEGADTHSRLSESDAANVAKPHDDPTAHRVADLRAQPQQPAVTKNSCHCPAKPGEDCPLTLEQCDARVAGETKGGQS